MHKSLGFTYLSEKNTIRCILVTDVMMVVIMMVVRVTIVVIVMFEAVLVGASLGVVCSVRASVYIV